MEYFGKVSIGKDGIKYKSQFEADFSDKFLYQKYSYEYEKLYNDGSKRKCDFYLNDLNLYIECVYHNFQSVPKYLTYDSKTKIILEKCRYEDRFEAKKFGAKWDPVKKIWWTTLPNYESERLKTGFIINQRLSALEKFMKEEDKESFFISEDKTINEDYDINLLKKLKYESNIIVVTHEDSQKCEDMNRIILKKSNDGIIRRFASEYITKITRLKKENENLRKHLSELMHDNIQGE